MPRETIWIVAVMILASVTFLVALLSPEKPTAYSLTRKPRRGPK